MKPKELERNSQGWCLKSFQVIFTLPSEKQGPFICAFSFATHWAPGKEIWKGKKANSWVISSKLVAEERRKVFKLAKKVSKYRTAWGKDSSRTTLHNEVIYAKCFKNYEMLCVRKALAFYCTDILRSKVGRFMEICTTMEKNGFATEKWPRDEKQQKRLA